MKRWYVCEALARQKLGLSEEYTLFAASMGYPTGQRQQGNWTHVKVGIGKKDTDAHWSDEHRGIIIYRHEIETYPGYEP